MTISIDAVPESVTLERVCDLIRSLGIDPDHVTDEGITIGAYAIRCNVYATNADGHRYLDETGEAVAKHQISIPVTGASLFVKNYETGERP